MKNEINKQPQNVPARLDADLLKRVKEKAQKENRNQIVVLNRLVKKALQFEDVTESSESVIS